VYVLFETIFLAFGIKIDYVQEVVHCQGLRKLPFLKPGVVGVLLIHDTVVPVIDLASVLGDGREGKGLDPAQVILLCYEGNRCAVLAGRVRILRGSDPRSPIKMEEGKSSPICRESLTIEEKTYAVIDIGSLFSHLGLDA
jgi:chemotaxis signal transduction protein